MRRGGCHRRKKVKPVAGDDTHWLAFCATILVEPFTSITSLSLITTSSPLPEDKNDAQRSREACSKLSNEQVGGRGGVEGNPGPALNLVLPPPKMRTLHAHGPVLTETCEQA